jgi:hypothetical protein
MGLIAIRTFKNGLSIEKFALFAAAPTCFTAILAGWWNGSRLDRRQKKTNPRNKNARRQDEGGILTTSGHIVSNFLFL